MEPDFFFPLGGEVLSFFGIRLLFLVELGLFARVLDAAEHVHAIPKGGYDRGDDLGEVWGFCHCCFCLFESAAA